MTVYKGVSCRNPGYSLRRDAQVPGKYPEKGFDIPPARMLKEIGIAEKYGGVSGASMIGSRSLFALFFGLLLLFMAGESLAVKYRYHYTNEKGESLFADDLQSVPEKYRGQAMIVSTDDADEKVQQAAEEERAQSAATVDAVVQERAEQQQQQAVTQVQAVKEKRLHIAWTAGIASAFIAALIALAKIDALRKHEKVVERVRSALAVLFLVYLIFAYGKDVIRLFSEAGETIAGMERKSAERGKKAAQFYKEMENMMEQAEAVQKEQEAQIKVLEEQQ